MDRRAPEGAGLGFRLAFAEELLASPAPEVSFVELAPENYLGAGGRRARLLAAAAERWPVVCHGLTTDLSGAAPLDGAALDELGRFLRKLGCRWYSDHLCFTHVAGAEVHDLLPLPFTHEAAARAAARIREVQDRLGLPVLVENVSAYARLPGAELDEPSFVAAVVREAGCGLLLDVNNVHVNAVNFGLDARAYVEALPLDRVVQLHVAGHEVEREGLLVDTHGAKVIDPVLDLLRFALERIPGRPPVLLERDHSFPPLAELLAEVGTIGRIVGEARRAAA